MADGPLARVSFGRSSGSEEVLATRPVFGS
jgi:hypothetical protein